MTQQNLDKINVMTRIVGKQDRNEFILDPLEAWQRGRVLDQMLKAARIPVAHGVRRAPHHVFNAIDDARQLAQARLLNNPPDKPPEPTP